jgi:signal transduction histidine kinase
MKKTPSLTLILTSGIAMMLLVSLGIFYWLMQPPMSDLGHMAQFLTFTAVISILAGYGAYRLGWLEKAPSLRWALAGTYVLASLLTFLNVWLTARLMFASEHDLLLATVLLIFAGGIAVAIGNFFAARITERLSRLESTAHEIEGGNLSARTLVGGNDEIASLAIAFNRMADRLQAADQKQKELETLRRDLVAWAGHDLRTPLASIRVMVEAISDGVVTDPQTIHQYLTQTAKQVDQITLLVDDLFQVSQLDAGGLILNRENASLSDLISDTLESFSELAKQKGINLRGSAEKGIDPLVMDVQLIGRVLNNLISNAIRHTPAGKEISLCASIVKGGVEVSVRDQGEGIRSEDLPHVFERFYRGEKSRSRASGGAGLGLAIAEGIVEAHGGNIRVDSEYGQGAVFTFMLPKA